MQGSEIRDLNPETPTRLWRETHRRLARSCRSIPRHLLASFSRASRQSLVGVSGFRSLIPGPLISLRKASRCPSTAEAMATTSTRLSLRPMSSSTTGSGATTSGRDRSTMANIQSQPISHCTTGSNIHILTMQHHVHV